MFNKVEVKPNFIELEHRILKFWEKNQIFPKLINKNRNGPRFRFIDGPMTANNPMGVHHAWGRTLKDVFQRHRAMCGYQQRFQNGFDCQGLWVEVEVEKDLGFKNKQDILSFGLENFIEKCKERVALYSDIQTKQSIRLGQWMDWANSYYTHTDTNIEYIWYFLKKCHQNGWLYLGHSVMPWCVRCGTSLSQHEMTDSYSELKHVSIYIKAPLKGSTKKESFLVWTTTPWTLSANAALALHPELVYVFIEVKGEILILAEKRLTVINEPYRVLKKVKGESLNNLEYQTPFPEFEKQDFVHRTVIWKDVSAEEGSGIVHIAPGCGAADFYLGQEKKLPVLVPISEDGEFVDGYGFLKGQDVQEVLPQILAYLKKKNILYKSEDVIHRYPICWRCKEELVFRVCDEWFISCEKIRPPLINAAGKVKWLPDYIYNRMVDWLTNMGDWCISRKRFWGLPLPFYVCPCGHTTVVGSRRELENMAAGGTDKLNELHLPWIDQVLIKCPECGKEVKRIKEVGDCWLDAGIVPFSTLRYLEDKDYWQSWYPADFICEMREQIRLWFYSMLFMAVTLEGTSPYEAVLAYEKVYDEKGEPMHKSKGNTIWFDEAVEKMGADVMRWIYCGWPPSNNLLFGYSLADETRRKLLTLWNCYCFFTNYARIDNPDLSGDIKQKNLTLTDKWILSRLHSLVFRSRKFLDAYNMPPLIKELETFIDDFSTWYIRLNRRRFWKSERDEDKNAAYSTLYHVFDILSRIIAPIIPFLAEEIYQNAVRPGLENLPESVHLGSFPEGDKFFISEDLEAKMEVGHRIVNLALSIRSQKGIKVRQPLAELLIISQNQFVLEAGDDLAEIIRPEVNIKSIIRVKDMPALPAADYEVAEEGDIKVALRTKITEVLYSEGLAREFVRYIQSIRKELDFEITDRIVIQVYLNDRNKELLRMFDNFIDYIKNETLCRDFSLVEKPSTQAKKLNIGKSVAEVLVLKL